MDVLIWDKINTWVIIQGDLLIVDKMFAEVENYMDITQHKANTKKELTMITMKQDKIISEFYHQIFALWTMAGTQSEDQIEIFQSLLSPWICNQLSVKQYTDFNTLLQNARLVEEMQKKNATCFSCQDKPTYNQSSGSSGVAPTSTSASKNARENGSTKGSSVGRQGFYNNPVITKPAEWTRQWHKPQTNPLKLTDADCKTLLKQRHY